MDTAGAQLNNLDIFAVGIAIAAIGILGVVVFLNNRKSVTSRTFLLFALCTILYGIVNSLSYRVSPEWILWTLRLTIFSAVWHAFSGFQLFYVFPKEKIDFPKWYIYGLVLFTASVSLLALTPLIFSGIEYISIGGVPQPKPGPALPLFGLTTIALVIGGLSILFRRTVRAKGTEKNQFQFVATGASITFALLILLNVVLPNVFENVGFIPLTPTFFLPFVLFTAYAIIKHHLLSVKIIATEILTFVLVVLNFSDIVLSRDLGSIIFRSGIFVLVLSFGILLINTVRREVEQREQLEKLTKELEAANAKLEELSHFKTQLLSLASHQIRSPLAAMKGFIQLLVDGSYGKIDNPKIIETLGKVKASADQLIDLINTLLDLRKVEEGKMDYQFAETDMRDLVANVYESLKPLASTKGLEFVLHVPKDRLLVSADAQKLRQVIQNIIDNAIKYTPTGSVTVELYEADHAVMFAVRDTGLGFAPEMASHLFEEFVRDERVKKQILGTGLGLYIARKIIEAHGGRIWAESKGPQKGSAFFVTIKKL